MRSLRPTSPRGRALLRSTRGAIALTTSHMFLGAISLGIGMFRGTEVYTAFHHETLVGHANFGASKLAADHARSANVVVNNNTVMAGIMGPRFGVEADNIAMDANAEIACPTCPHSPTCSVCMQYHANKPRALAKLVWVRAEQTMLWGTLGKLSGEIDRLAFQQASGIIAAKIGDVDAQVKIRFEDPSESGDLWGGSNADVACKLSVKDILPTPVTGHAFPLLISPNLLEGLPKALVQMMPQVICAVTAAAQNAGGGSGSSDGPQLGQIPSVAKQTQNDCTALETQMRCSVAAAAGNPGSCGDYSAPEFTRLDSGATVQFSSDVQPYVECQTATTSSPLQDGSAGGYSYRSRGGALVTCSFDHDKCLDKQLTKNTDSYLRKELGLASVVTNLAASLGGSETRKPSAGGSNPQNFCACSHTSRPIDPTVIRISDNVRKIASFGASDPSDALRKQREYRSCGRWYFPARKGPYASTPEDQQPFVAAWKFGLVTQCAGGGT